MITSFGNRSFAVHVLRGVGGFGSLYLALAGYERIGWPALVFFGVALWMLKGCPVCWTIGLFETLALKVFLKEGERETLAPLEVNPIDG